MRYVSERRHPALHWPPPLLAERPTALQGAGVLNFTAGTTQLTGDGTGFTGVANVNGGNLAVTTTLGGTTNVLSGRLSGTGTVGTLNVSGIVAPGDSIGT